MMSNEAVIRNYISKLSSSNILKKYMNKHKYEDDFYFMFGKNITTQDIYNSFLTEIAIKNNYLYRDAFNISAIPSFFMSNILDEAIDNTNKYLDLEHRKYTILILNKQDIITKDVIYNKLKDNYNSLSYLDKLNNLKNIFS